MKTTITPILGRIFCPDREIDDDFKGLCNSTRWIFDVEHEFETVNEDDEELSLFHIQLAEHRTGRIIKPEIFSFTIGAMSEEVYEAAPHLVVRNGLIHIIVRPLDGGSCKYRISIDSIHSSSR